jgi:GNAT superfamily N-acetyltransferase
MTVVIRNLADYPQHVPLVARWQWEEWDHKLGRTLEEMTGICREWCQRNALPWGIIALDEDRPVGCMTLLANDLSDRSDLTPWLACQYVAPEYRGHDVARRLAAALEERALSLGYRRLYMWTEHNPEIYRRFGWQAMFKAHEYGMEVTVMGKDYPDAPG